MKDSELSQSTEVSIKTKKEIKKWSRFFGCSDVQLVHAVFSVGTTVRALDAYLEMNGHKKITHK